MNKMEFSLAEIDNLDELNLLLEEAYSPINDILCRPPGVLVGTRDMLKERISKGWVYRIQLKGENGRSQQEIFGTFDLEIKNKNLAILSHFALLPRYQQKGYGKKILTYILAEARRIGAREMELEVYRKIPHLIRFYQKFGFKETYEKKIKGERIVIMSSSL